MISINLIVSSYYDEILKRICLALYMDASEVIHQEDDIFKTCILSISTDNYETQPIISQMINYMHQLSLQISTQDKDNICCQTSIAIDVSEADDCSIPGIAFPAEFISLATELCMQMCFCLNIHYYSRPGQINSGAYFYIESDEEIDSSYLNTITGTQATIIYRKGEMGKYRIVDFYAWGIEIINKNEFPDTTVATLMKCVRNAKNVGRYCQDNKLDSHVDIICYSIPPETTTFQLDSSFFSFLKDLSIQYLAIDFMT